MNLQVWRMPIILLGVALIAGCGAATAAGSPTTTAVTPTPVPASPPALPSGPIGQAIKDGRTLFMHSGAISGNGLSCTSCHLDGGTRINTVGGKIVYPLIGAAATFPKYSPRTGTIVTLQQQIEKCIEGGLHGQPLPTGSQQLADLEAYVTWLSEGHPIHLGNP